MKTSIAIIFMSSAFLLAACSTTKSPQLAAKFQAVNFLNPNINNQPAPVVVTLFQLKSPTAFQQANFFALYNKPAATLNSDLLDKREVEVRPGQKVEIEQTLSSDAHYIGILAAFRDPDTAQWRQVVPVNAGNNIRLKINLAAQNLSAKLN